MQGLSKGQILYKLRQEAGVTQQEVADYIGMSLQSVSKYESGERKWGTKTAGLLVAFFTGKVEHTKEQLEDWLASERVRRVPAEDRETRTFNCTRNSYLLIKALARARDCTMGSVILQLLETAERDAPDDFARARKIIEIQEEG